MNSIKKFTTQEEFETYMNTPSKLLTLGILDDGRPMLKGSLCQISYKTTDNKAIALGTTEGFGATYTGTEYLYSGNLSFDNQVTTIPEGAFSDNDKLSEVTIPESVETIETGAFSNAENLQKVTIEGAPTIEENAFNGISETGTIVVKNPEVLADSDILEQFDGWNGYTESGETSIIGGGDTEPDPDPEPEPEEDYSKVAMFFENADDKAVTIGVKNNGISANTGTLQTSTDGKTWEDWGSTSTTAITQSVPVGGKLYIRAKANVGYFDNVQFYYNYFNSDGEVNVGGNIMSLGYKDFEDKTSITQEYAYNHVFYKMTKLMDASKLVLPATTLAARCYQNMFEGCTSLTKAPALPATALADYCYYAMFHSCTSLTTAPELPATKLVNSCYSSMFYKCTGLTSTPVLLATELANSCYRTMFGFCESLTTAPELPATELASWCYSSMFNSCTGLTTAPELPATELVENCYQYMFSGCSKLNYIKAMFISTPSETYTEYWVSGVSSTGTFVKNTAATWDVTGTNGIPTGWTVQKATA